MDGDGWYSILSRTARIGGRMMHLKANMQPKVGAAREPNAGNARATVGCTDPNAERTITESDGARNGRPRRQSPDCREGRT